MSKRVVGYVLISTALVLTFLALVTAYNPSRSLLSNLSYTRILEVSTTTSEVKRCPSPPAPVTIEMPNTGQPMTIYRDLASPPPLGCARSRNSPDYRPDATYTSYRKVTHFAGITLGTVTAVIGTVALVGVGLMVFGGGRQAESD